MDFIDVILLAIIGILVLAVYTVKSHSDQKEPDTDKATIYPYSSKNLLTKTEYIFYNILKKKCDENNLLICPKVRMEDFITVTDKEHPMKYRGYIKARHIDFLICDSKLHILTGLELDDNSHNQPKAKEIDDFKNKVFEKIGLPLFRVSTNSNFENEIDSIISNLIKK